MRGTSTVHSEPAEGPAALSVLEGVAVGERVLVSLVDVVVAVEGDWEVVVSVGVELAIAVGLGVGVAPPVMVEDEVAVVSPSRSSHRSQRGS